MRFLLNLQSPQVSPVHISGFRVQRVRGVCFCRGNPSGKSLASSRTESCSGVRSLFSKRHVVQVAWTDSRGGTVTLPAVRCWIRSWTAAWWRHLPGTLRLNTSRFIFYDNRFICKDPFKPRIHFIRLISIH